MAGIKKIDAALDQKSYQSLSLPEKFTYNMIYRESFSQICTIEMGNNAQWKIFAQLPRLPDDYYWSTKQLAFFLDNKDSVTTLMSSCILEDQWIGANFKHVIVNINATVIIPLIINIYKTDRQDQSLLTVLMLLMKESKYNEFLSSTIYKRLYEDKNASYKSSINMSTENANLIIRYATNFYNAPHN